jgi:hypothetical protein
MAGLAAFSVALARQFGRSWLMRALERCTASLAFNCHESFADTANINRKNQTTSLDVEVGGRVRSGLINLKGFTEWPLQMR